MHLHMVVWNIIKMIDILVGLSSEYFVAAPDC